MNKIIRIGTGPYGDIYCRIQYDDKRLSITGVEGPMRNGDARGSCGQIRDSIRSYLDAQTIGDSSYPHGRIGPYADGWTRDIVLRFLDVWDRWHLNDMSPMCTHQRALGWDEIARRSVNLYHWTLTDDASSKQKAAKSAALDALRQGQTFTPTKEQSVYASLSYDRKTHTPDAPQFYQRIRDGSALGAHVESKTLGWLKPDEHPDGLLCKPCPVCGYKYGTAWMHEDVPADVLQFLASLPDADQTPAWV